MGAGWGGHAETVRLNHLRHLYNEPPYGGDLFRTIKITITATTTKNIQNKPKDSWVYLNVRNIKTGPSDRKREASNKVLRPDLK